MNIRAELESRFSLALQAVGAEGAPALVSPAGRAQFGDYQVNGVMSAAKARKTNPHRLAQQVLGHVDLTDLAEKIEIAGPGFINITLNGGFLSKLLSGGIDDERLGIARARRPQTIVVDYSHPNVAKEMHVGHLRSTIIGDAIVRTLEFLGHNVIRQNHIGDWGTQFGMLIAHLDQVGADSRELADLEEFYRRAKQQFDADPAFADKARSCVVRLQAGDEQVLQSWRPYIETSLRHCEQIYEKLGVTLNRSHVRGESAYNDDLPKVVADLEKAGMLKVSQGAKCVFLDEFLGKDGQVLPVIVQKADGGYLYATTDLAAIRYRANVLKADRILYIVDARQNLHLRQVFAAARAAGFVSQNVSLEHHPFGMILGEDRRPFKTRQGETVKLMDLLDEAVSRAGQIVEEKNPDLNEVQKAQIAQAVGVGAVKYADLSQNRASDYVFSWEKMLSLDGNTAPYMQYAYARIRSIFRKGRSNGAKPAHQTGAIEISHPAERALSARLVRFAETIEAVSAESMPNILCAYLYDLAGVFMGFYESCPVLVAPEPTRTGRLMLCDLAARTIGKGLDLLGIKTIEQM